MSELTGMTAESWRKNPRRLGMMLARYKFVAKMLAGRELVAEIGSADGFGAEIVRREVGTNCLFDREFHLIPKVNITQHDIVDAPLPGSRGKHDGIYLLDVFEHIHPLDIDVALNNIAVSLKSDGIAIIGTPSLEAQWYAWPEVKSQHCNCVTGEQLAEICKRHFSTVLSFGMNDEVLHTGHHAMCHYLFAVCIGPKMPLKPVKKTSVTIAIDVDKSQVDGGALALCQLYCPSTKSGGVCEKRCMGHEDLGIWNSSHMTRMREMALAVLSASPATEPTKNVYDPSGRTI